MIRKAKISDLPRLAELGLEFYKESGLPGKLIPHVFVKSWTTLMEAGVGVMFVYEQEGIPVGAIAGVAFPDINDGDLVLTETFWFISKSSRGGGIKLLDAFEAEAKRMEATRITMVHLKSLAPEILEKIYCRRGYSPVETHYIKSI